MMWSSFKRRISTQPFDGHFNIYFMALKNICSPQNILKVNNPLYVNKLFSWVCCISGSNLDIFYFNIFNKYQYQHLRRGKKFSCPKTAWEIVVLVILIQWPKQELFGIQNLNSSSNNKSLFTVLLELCKKFNKFDNLFIKTGDT